MFDKLRAEDLEHTCIHESAHKILVNYYKAKCHIIIRDSGTKDYNKLKLFNGTIFITTSEFNKLTKKQKRYVSLAGGIAEYMYNSICKKEYELTLTDLYEQIEEDFNNKDMSAADMSMIDKIRIKDVAEVIALLFTVWNDFIELSTETYSVYALVHNVN